MRGLGFGGTRCLWTTFGRCAFCMGILVAGGEPALGEEAIEDEYADDEDTEDGAGTISGRGAMGIAMSTVLLYAGYPSHGRPARTHFRPAPVSIPSHRCRVSPVHTLRSRLIALNSAQSAKSSARPCKAWPDHLLAVIAARLDLGPTRPPLALHYGVFCWCFHIIVLRRRCAGHSPRVAQ